MIIGVDFDGVIHDGGGPGALGEPIPDARKYLRRLQNHKIIIFTARNVSNVGARIVVENWLKLHKIPYDELTNIKPNADVYIDDRAYRFDNWPNAFKFVRYL